MIAIAKLFITNIITNTFKYKAILKAMLIFTTSGRKAKLAKILILVR